MKSRSDVAAIYHLGDLVGYAPWPDEVVNRIRVEGIPGIAGNYDSPRFLAVQTPRPATCTPRERYRLFSRFFTRTPSPRTHRYPFAR